MAPYSEAELDVKAKATVFSLDRNLAQNSIVKKISDLYITFCESSRARKLSIKPRKVTEGVELRLLFELLCFTSFLTSQIIPNYVSTRKLVLRKTNYELVRYYSGQVAKHLEEFCQDLGMTKLREIIFISPPPDVKLKLGDPLHPNARLTEYAECHAERKGREVQHFAQHVSKALDPYHYPTLEVLWNAQVMTFKKLAERVMAEVFKPSVKLESECKPG
ncbi:MAG: hypothetical protein JSV14_09330 [Deltaproteobacteria bacterium]|nr:MAG: hypothetical protein JSV14_09330 [Deltaproteobacteria bacterium]